MNTLTIIAHTPSKNATEIVESIRQGASTEDFPNVQCKLESPFSCDQNTVLNSTALILFTTENFGYMNGALKDFFERIYYPCLENPPKNDAKPYALVIRAGNDGTGAKDSVEKIIKGLNWKQTQSAALFRGEFQQSFLTDAFEIGQMMAARCENDIF